MKSAESSLTWIRFPRNEPIGRRGQHERVCAPFHKFDISGGINALSGEGEILIPNPPKDGLGGSP